MRITYIHQYFNTPSMSGSTRSYEMAKHLVKLGHEVNIITTWREENKRESNNTNEDGINVFWIPIPYSNYMNYKKRIYSFVKFAYLSYRKAISIESDIIFASSTPLTVSLPGIYASRKLKVPFVFEVRDLWPEMPIAIGAIKNPILKKITRQLEKFSYKNSDAIVALSKGMKEGILKTGYPSEKIIVIPNASDLDNFNPLKLNRNSLRIKYGIPLNSIVMLYPGTFGKINGVEYLVKLAKSFKTDPRIFFLTVGDGQEFEHVERIAIESGCLDGNLKMLKKVSKSEVADIFECSDIVISTVINLKELESNSANKFFDGLAAGCCITINHKGWMSDLLETYECGFTLSQDIDEASAKLLNWIDSPNKIFLAGKKARIVAENNFNRVILANKLNTLLVDVYNNNKNKFF